MKPDHLMMNAWKQQIGTALRLVETLAEQMIKIREMMGDAYKRWLDTTSRIYAASGVAAKAEVRKAA